MWQREHPLKSLNLCIVIFPLITFKLINICTIFFNVKFVFEFIFTVLSPYLRWLLRFIVIFSSLSYFYEWKSPLLIKWINIEMVYWNKVISKGSRLSYNSFLYKMKVIYFYELWRNHTKLYFSFPYNFILIIYI